MSTYPNDVPKRYSRLSFTPTRCQRTGCNCDGPASAYRSYPLLMKRQSLHNRMAAIVVSDTVSARCGETAVEAGAKAMLKAMTEYVAAQKAISFDYDVNLEVVTKDDQKLTLAASGNVELARPDKIRASRSGGFADIETVFDGKTLTILGKNMNIYTQVAIPGSIDHLVDELREKYHRPLPAADLLTSNSYDGLMEDVVDVKDLGSGVIGGTECDHLAFRKKDVDWQIWIAQGSRRYPCRYDIATKVVAGSPGYSIQIRALENRQRCHVGRV